MSEHTPLPWSTSGMNIIGADRTVVCTVNRPAGDTSAAAFRNQDLIMAACNAHDNLLEACEAIVVAAEYGNLSPNNSAVDLCRAAIAKKAGAP